MKKPIKFNDLSNPLQAVIIICCGICAVFLIFAIYNPRIDLQSQIDSLPHKYCYNETKYGDTVYAGFKADFIIENLRLNPYEVRRFECVPNKDGDTICVEIISEKEVCEIR